MHVPNHWTLAIIRWDERRVIFHDSLPDRVEAEEDEELARDLIWGLLKMMPAHFKFSRELAEWQWVSEFVRIHSKQVAGVLTNILQRPARQVNGHDCGAFVMADLTSYIRTDAPSSLTQGGVAKWRATVTATLRTLPVRRPDLDEDDEAVDDMVEAL